MGLEVLLMFENLRINPDQKKLVNLPEDWTTLFLAKTPGMHGFIYAAIICQIAACTLAEQNALLEIGGKTKLILFTVENVRIHEIHHGHKYPHGGGMVEIDHNGRGATWTTPDEHGQNIVFDHRIYPVDVLVAL